MAFSSAVLSSTVSPSSSLRDGKFSNSFRQTRKSAVRRARFTAQLELKPPPYSLDALEPYMSRETLEYHWGKHQRGYVENLNRQIAGTDLDELDLEEIITRSYNRGNPLPAFNSAAQVWNHEFFWKSMKPGGGGKPSGLLLQLIERDFGSLDRLLDEFKRAALTQFGSGWAWLAYKANTLDVGNAVNPCPSDADHKLVIHKSPNAVNPLVWDYHPLLAIDVWEHAYYIDYENRRAEFVSAFIDKLVSWEAASVRLDEAMAIVAEKGAKEEERRRREEEGYRTEEEDDTIVMFMDSDNESESE